MAVEDTNQEDKAVVDPQAEVNARAQEFLKEYGELVAKHKMDFATYPMFVPDGQGGFRVVVRNTPVDMTQQPTPSPIAVAE